MTSKKYQFLLGLMLITSAAFSQNPPSGYSVWDSSVISSKDMPQQNEFWNNAYNFPAKPRSQWEVGLSLGNFSVSGDIPSTNPSLGFSAHVRRSIGYIFSLRLQYLNGVGKGMNWKANTLPDRTTAWDNASADYANNRVVYSNFKNNSQDLSLQGIFTLNNIRFHKNQTNLVLYAGAGIGATAYQTKLNALDASNKSYSSLFASVYSNAYTAGSDKEAIYKNRKNIISALKDGMDDTYETDANIDAKKGPQLGDNSLRFSSTVLAGLAYRLSNKLNVALENRHTFVKDDMLDGSKFQESGSLTSNWDSYNYLSLGINYNVGKKAIEPLWWINPLDYAYSELNNPKHMKLPKPTYEDSDGDGVVDQLDREPNTPAGVNVSTTGISMDTDGDGVPDSKDKQMITPTECQPVDADGVGKCPEPECCKDLKSAMDAAATGGKGSGNCPCDYPSLSFSGNTAGLSANAKTMLGSIAEKMKANPGCSITLTGYPEASKAAQSNCQKRVNAARTYLIEKQGISADRIMINCEIGGGENNTVDVKCN
jgi:hypothetical protein